MHLLLLTGCMLLIEIRLGTELIPLLRQELTALQGRSLPLACCIACVLLQAHLTLALMHSLLHVSSPAPSISKLLRGSWT